MGRRSRKDIPRTSLEVSRHLSDLVRCHHNRVHAAFHPQKLKPTATEMALHEARERGEMACIPLVVGPSPWKVPPALDPGQAVWNVAERWRRALVKSQHCTRERHRRTPIMTGRV